MLDGEHYRTAQLVNELTSNAQMKHIFDLIECLKPTLSIVDNHQGGKAYCYDYNGIITAGGETVYSAMTEFSRKYYSQKAQSKNTSLRYEDLKCEFCNGKGEKEINIDGADCPTICTFCNGTGIDQDQLKIMKSL